MTDGSVAALARKVRILIVDDHPIVREGYAQLISRQQDLEVCAEADTVGDALRVAREALPHLVIVDIMLNDGNGIDLIERLKMQQPAVTILAVSAHDESLYAERSLRAGAQGFVNKKAVLANLILAIRRVLDGEIYLSEHASARLLQRIAGSKPIRQNAAEGLSNRELEAYTLIGQGLTSSEIARRMHVSPKTVERYKENIKRKLHLANATELLQHATRWMLDTAP